MRRRWRELDRVAVHGAVDALPTRRRLQALACLGWPGPWVARMAGLSPKHASDFVSRDRVTRATEAVIRAVYDELCMRVPVGRSKGERVAITRTRNTAAVKGWVPPLGWDDIDDPGENPGEREAA